MSSVLLHSFSMRGHEFRAYWMPDQKRWFAQNKRAEFDFPGCEDDGMGKVKAALKKVLRDQYRYLLDNASRVIARVNGVEAYLDCFPYRVRKQWAEAAVLMPLA